jgi:hypothetical protein
MFILALLFTIITISVRFYIKKTSEIFVLHYHGKSDFRVKN